MKRLLAVAFAFVSIPMQAETFSIATFNAEFLYPSKVHVKYGLNFQLSREDPSVVDQWSDPGFVQDRYKEAVLKVAAAISEIDSDVLTLTEVGDSTALAVLVSALEDQGASWPHITVCDCTDNNTGQHVAILSKLPLSNVVSQLVGREGYTLEEDDADEQKDTGVSKGMSATVTTAGGTEINVYALHLASERGGHEKDQQRIAQASIVRRMIIPALNENQHVVVTGDLNDRRGSPTLRRLRGLDDIWPDLIQTGHWKYFEREEEDSRWTYRFRGELNQIDHILVSYSLRRTQSSGISTNVLEIPQSENPSTSDHRPMIVSIDIP